MNIILEDLLNFEPSPKTATAAQPSIVAVGHQQNEKNPLNRLSKSDLNRLRQTPLLRGGPRSTDQPGHAMFLAVPEMSREPLAMPVTSSEQKNATDEEMIKVSNEAKRLRDVLVNVIIPVSKQKQSRQAFPPSQAIEIYGPLYLYRLGYHAYQAMLLGKRNRCYIHLPDVQAYLQDELVAAHRFLSNPASFDLWTFSSNQLATAIHSHQDDIVARIRSDYDLAATARVGATGVTPHTIALAWAIIVDAALLNQQLIQDMREATAAKGQPMPPVEHLAFHLPNPDPMARQAFKDYVRIRFPIRVFALDPENQDQNLGDALQTKRETQLALSLAFVAGKLSARNLTRWARRLDAEYATIAINRTQVGFSHGEDTFGWRFYPRYQTPDTPSNFTATLRDQWIGGPSRDQLLRERRLEPGIRECVAIVVMPSFVPYITLDATTNWFKLTDPKCKVLDHEDAVALSRIVKSLQLCAHEVRDADCYRDGELPRLRRRVDQLEARLPTQTMVVPVPIENTLGGFALFSNGITDLAPELYGFYGAPGIDPNKETTLYLVGDNFSVNQTSVLVGNCEVTDKQLLSRQVIRAKIEARKVNPRKDGKVEVHVATPYGVTATLAVPLVQPKKEDPPKKEEKPAASYSWQPGRLWLGYTTDCQGILPPPQGHRPLPEFLSIRVTDGKFEEKAKQADVIVHVPNPYDPKDQVSVLLQGAECDPGSNTITISPALVERLAQQLRGEFRVRFGPEQCRPPAPLATSTTTVQLKSDAKTNVGQAITFSSPLQIHWMRIELPHAAPMNAPIPQPAP